MDGVADAIETWDFLLIPFVGGVHFLYFKGTFVWFVERWSITKTENVYFE